MDETVEGAWKGEMRFSGFGEVPVVINDEEKMGSSES